MLTDRVLVVIDTSSHGQQDSQEMSIFSLLLNNVSTLEAEILAAHRQFKEVRVIIIDCCCAISPLSHFPNKQLMSKWSQHRRLLTSIPSEDELYDVDHYSSELLSLLTKQRTQIGDLIESVSKFRTGLAQLKQSVMDH